LDSRCTFLATALVVFGFVGQAGAPSIVCVNVIPFFLIGVLDYLEFWFMETIFGFEEFYLPNCSKLIYGFVSFSLA